jgi:gliding motility-associated-like protein
MRTFLVAGQLGFACSCLIPLGSGAQNGLQVMDTLTHQELVELLVGGGLQVSNITVTCAQPAYGSFDGTACNIGMGDGMILTSGYITNAPGPNDNDGITGDNSDPGDSALTNLAANTTFDACIFEFDLIPIFDTLKFNYVFGSDEYLEYVNAGYNDVFGFFISGPGIVGTKNIALIPGTSTPVAIDNVNNLVNVNYYVDNGDGYTAPYNSSPHYVQYDGFTTVLEAKQAVQPCQTYHLRLAIADVGDYILDSGVFIEGGSLVSAGVKLTVGSSAGGSFPYAIEACTDGSFTFARDIVTPLPEVVHFVIGGSATNGVDYPVTADSIVIPGGQASFTLPVIPTVDALSEGTESMVIYLVDPCFGGYIDSAVLYLLDDMNVETSGDPTICEGDSAAIWASGGTAFSWVPASSVDDPASAEVLAFPSTTTTYTVEVTADQCTETATVTVHVNPAPPVNAGPDVSICDGGQAQLTASGAASYQWGPSAGLNGTTIPNPMATPAATTTYTVTGTGTNGCVASDQVTVTVNPLPTAHAFPDTTICSGEQVQLHATGGVTYLWAPAPIGLPPVPDPIVMPTVTTVFTVTVTDANGCTDEDMVTISVIPSPTIDAGPDTVIVLGQNVMLQGSSDGIAFNWLPESDLSDPTILNPVATPAQTTTYFLTATGSNGCNSSDSVTVIVLTDAVVAVPNAFSPNGDNTNDFLWIKSLGTVAVDYFRVYNRWGGIVFETGGNGILESETSGWDGTSGGTEQPIGVYAYVFKGSTPTGETIIQSGNISLLR